jgi:trimethylamine--corrinoid protein Co-methyltransferase
MRLSVLEPADLDRLHDASLHILQRIGVRIPHGEMRTLFAGAGAEVDEAGQIVRIPEALVERSLASAGKHFTLYGRGHDRQARFGQGERNYNSSGGQALWLDDAGADRRYASLADVAVAARLGDALPSLTIVGAMADPHELPIEWRRVAVAAELLRHTTKPVLFFFQDRASTRYVLEALLAVAGGGDALRRHPPVFPFLEPISPLKFPFDGIDLLFETAVYDLPAPIGPMAQVGASAPGTLIGTLAQENAEILAGVCVTQLIKPGLPVCYGGIPHAFDMRTSQIIFGGPEQALMGAAMAQMGQRYGLPTYVNVGLTDSKLPDAQAGMEAGVTLAMGMLAGADIFGHFGICGADQGASLPMLMLQHELSGYLERVMRGIAVSDDRIALDVIEAVGHDGSFLAEAHTVQNFRKELWFPKLLDRQYWSNWMAAGHSNMHARLIAEKDRLLSKHEPTPLDPALDREIDRIVASARKEL